MLVKHLTFAVISIIILSGCGSKPKLINANPAGVEIGGVFPSPREMDRLANEHCAKYDRYARVSHKDYETAGLGIVMHRYECVK